MKVIIIGYGKMGKAVEQILLEKGHDVVLKLSSEHAVTPDLLTGADVAIEFTQPSAALHNIHACIAAHLPVVTGTTGWYAALPQLREEVANTNGSLFFASNFSIGVNVFAEILRNAAQNLATREGYRPAMREIHHLAKKDAPSGTALTLADVVLDEFAQLHGWTDKTTNSDALYIESVREGDVKGTHEVSFTSNVDRITLTHEAFSREGFARGAVTAAEWLHNRKGVFTMRDLLNHPL
jgi:4-hydroxy-tetrahydrodipicolinate reductase